MTTRLYTRRGDDGRTDLLAGARIRKDDPRIAAIGEVDELNACLGWALIACEDGKLRQLLSRVQHRLFEMGAELALPGPGISERIVQSDVENLEKAIDETCAALSPLREFILPGGSELAARLHLARCVCRRAERACCSVGDPLALVYLNRLGDLLFALARLANHMAGTGDVPWHKVH
ncbi:MAG: cob(I)yrinic acid a,c-diamide adenosyltransferase [Phycisphaeraceae bacterium]|nr:cob(I)yrinic acid a,c-diamide adenosyltransferase [Phycisphaeraceae bacterium]